MKEAFSLLDQNSDGIVERQDLTELLTSVLGRPPTTEQLDEMMLDIPKESNGMNFTLFLTLMGEKIQEIDGEDELLAAFEVLDEQRTGYISTDQLSNFLTKMGDPLSEEEFDQMLRCADLNSAGHFNYRHFVKAITHANE